ncbi:MAG: haloacid dehalogenase [Acidimicrobiia bacterium]|nr:haloacid dehalogenase [Acidimicrobiia bacterium]
MSDELGELTGAVRPILDSRFKAREHAIATSRKVIRSSANAIRNLHRGDVEAADELIAEAKQLYRSIVAATVDHPELLHVGYAHDAAKELSEASLTAAMFAAEPLPGYEELGVDPVPFLHGLGETVGECRRRLLDRLRAGDLETAERLLDTMDTVVDMLASLDYPDGMTNSLRRTTDVSRSLVERSRSDLTTTVVQERLRTQIEADGRSG